MRSDNFLTNNITERAIKTVIEYEESLSLSPLKNTNSILRCPQLLVGRTITAGLRVMGHVLCAIENVAYAAINLLGMVFSDDYSFYHAIGSTERALIEIAHASIELALSPFKILHCALLPFLARNDARSCVSLRDCPLLHIQADS